MIVVKLVNYIDNLQTNNVIFAFVNYSNASFIKRRLYAVTKTIYMKRVFFTFILTLCTTTICMADCPAQIKAFYKTYLTNVLYEITSTKNDALCKEYLTKEAIAQVDELVKKTGADPIIRAQDTNATAVQTLNVKQIEDNCYIVSYLWNKNDSSSITKIPLKAQMFDGRCKITYFAPEPLETIEE